MKRIIVICLLFSAFGTIGASAPGPKRAKQQRISITTGVDRTALWVGDTFQYTVRALHDPEIEFVLDNLKKESLNLAPFVVRDLSVRQGPFGGTRKLLEVTLFLTTYESGQTELKIPPFNLYYFTRKPGLEKKEETRAEAFPVPPMKVGLRSTLTGEALKPRDTKEIREIAIQEWLIPLILGLLGMTSLGVPAVRWAWAAFHVERPKKRRITRRARERMVQDFLKRAQGIGKESAQDHIRFYTEVSQFVREYLSEWLEVDAASLTPQEIEMTLKNLGRDGLGQPIKRILEKCEQVLYTRNGLELAGQWRDEVQAEVGKLP